MPAFNGQAQDLQGNAVTDFQVEVRDEETSNLASIYSNRELTTPLGNPFTPNPLNNGHFIFYVANGIYRIRAFTVAGDVADWRDVPIGDDVAALSEDFLNEDENLSDVDDPETAWDNIKQVASDANIRAASGDNYVSAEAIESASALVGLTDAATVAVNWDSGINFALQITENRVLGNPTNGQPGTWRTIYLNSDAGPDTLSFGNQYFGPAVEDPPAPESGVNDYVLHILCVNSSFFVVTATEVVL